MDSRKNALLLQCLVDTGKLQPGQTIYFRVDGKRYKCRIDTGVYDKTYPETFLVYENVREDSPKKFLRSVFEHLGKSNIKMNYWKTLYILENRKKITLSKLAKSYSENERKKDKIAHELSMRVLDDPTMADEPPYVLLQELVDAKFLQRGQTLYFKVDGIIYECSIVSGLYDNTYEDTFLVYKDIRKGTPKSFMLAVLEHLGKVGEWSNYWESVYIIKDQTQITLLELVLNYLKGQRRGVCV